MAVTASSVSPTPTMPEPASRMRRRPLGSSTNLDARRVAAVADGSRRGARHRTTHSPETHPHRVLMNADLRFQVFTVIQGPHLKQDVESDQAEQQTRHDMSAQQR